MTLAIGSNQGMGDVEHGKTQDSDFPAEYRRLFDGPSRSIVGTLHTLGFCTSYGGPVVGTIIKPKLSLQPSAEDCCGFSQDGDAVKSALSDERDHP